MLVMVEATPTAKDFWKSRSAWGPRIIVLFVFIPQILLCLYLWMFRPSIISQFGWQMYSRPQLNSASQVRLTQPGQKPEVLNLNSLFGYFRADLPGWEDVCCGQLKERYPPGTVIEFISVSGTIVRREVVHQ